jgi:uncharacterized protein (TIGR03437 family)
VDGSGVYVVGIVDDPFAGEPDFPGLDSYLRKYDANGNHQWTRVFGSNGNDSVASVAVFSGSVYSAGTTTGAFAGQSNAGGNFDAFLVKYDTSGNAQWTRQFGTSGDDLLREAAVNDTGAYVAGSSSGALPGQVNAGGEDVILRKYDATGSVVWTVQFGTASADIGSALALDGLAVFLGGRTLFVLPGQTSAGDHDGFVQRYEPNGSLTWTKQFGTNAFEEVSGLAVDGGALFAAGQTNGTLPGQTRVGAQDCFVVRFSAGSPSKLYSVSRTGARIRELNSSGATLTNVPINLPGRTVNGAQGLATDPTTGVMYALVSAIPGGTVSPNVRDLVTLNPVTGAATFIGPADNGSGLAFADIAFASNGTLYGVTGDGSPASPETLFTINKSTGIASLARTLGNGEGGEAIAFNSSDGLMYHASGFNDGDLNPPPAGLIFEKFDLTTFTAQQIPLSGALVDEATALTYDTASNAFLWSGYIDSSVMASFLRVTPSGVATLLGTLDHVAGGLAFYTPQACSYAIQPISQSTGASGGTGNVAVTAATGCAWTAVSNAGFITITSGASGSGNGAVAYSVAANPGVSSRNGTVTIAGQTFSVTQAGVSVTPVISVSPSVLDFVAGPGGGVLQRTFEIRASGGTVSWSATPILLNGTGWLALSAQSGTATPANPSKVIVSGDFNSLSTGFYQAEITVRDTATNATSAVLVRATVSAAGKARLAVSPTTAVWYARAGGTAPPPPQTMQIFNSGDAPLNWNIPADVQSQAPWLSFSASSGTVAPGGTAAVSLAPNAAGLDAGIYQAIVRVSAAGSGIDSDLLVATLHVVPADAPPRAEASLYGMIFVAPQGGPVAAPQNLIVSNAGSGTLTFSLQTSTTSGGPWLTAPSSGNATLGPVTAPVSVNASGLLPGFFRGKITATLSTGPAQEISVLLIVTPPADIAVQRDLPQAAACTPANMDFEITTIGNGISLPVSFPRTLLAQVVDNCGSGVNGATLVATVEGRSIVLRGVGGGLYNADWTPEQAAPAVPVTVVTTHPVFPTVQRSFTVSTAAAVGGIVLPVLSPDGVVDGAGFTPLRPLAPGGIISLFGSNFAADALGASAVPLPTALGGVSVRLSGADIPLYFVGAGQINAQMPVSAQPGNRAVIVVRAGGRLTAPQGFLVAQAQPGIFKSGDFAAVLDSEYRPINAQNPARPGDTVQIFATGLGLTDPPASTGELPPPFTNVQAPVTVTIGGVEMPVSYQGLAPGYVGLYQVNAVLPEMPAGTHALVLRQNGIASNPILPVSIPVQ